MADTGTETPESRPKCDYIEPGMPAVCGSEESLNRVIWSPGVTESNGVVCNDHREKVWRLYDVQRIEPLERVTK